MEPDQPVCAQCSRRNRPGSWFCGACGAALTGRSPGSSFVSASASGAPCPQCNHRNRAAARFCGRCSVPLVAPAVLRPDPLPPGTPLGRDGRYRIDRQLGKGGFGEAYLAEDTHLGRACVVKRLVLNPAWDSSLAQHVSANFNREARLLVELNNPGHPNIPEIYEYLPESRCLVMKFVTGSSLFRLLKRRLEPLPEAEALRYVRDACAALVYMHSRTPEPVLHRDLKPDNIMLDEIGRVWVIDFGLAKASPAALPAGDASLTQYSGTRGYAPPEQWRGQVEPRSDVFALAATLYELLTQQRPAHVLEDVTPLRRLNPAARPEVERLIQRGMSAAADDRPSSAQLLAELEDLLVAANIEKPPPPAPAPAAAGAVGRAAELEALAARLAASGAVTITGMAGVGKTTLAALLARRFVAVGPAADSALPRVFWHTCRAGEGADLLAGNLAGWLFHQGQPQIWQLIQRAQQDGGQPPDLEMLASFLVRALAGRGYLLCFDDVYLVESDPPVARLLDRLHQAARDQALALIIATRVPPKFAPAADVSSLAGLGERDTLAFLSQRGLRLDGELATHLHAVTGGNPQLLVLALDTLREATDPGAMIGQLARAGDVRRYLLQQVDAALSAEERRVMVAVASLLGYGGARDAIEAVLDGDDAWYILEELCARSLLLVEQREEGAVYYQHAIVQGFYYERPRRAERQELHWRAARYYEREEQDALGAARHYGRAGRPEDVARLLTTRPWRLFRAGHARPVYEELGKLDVERLDAGLRAAVWTAHGEAAALLGEYEAARALLEQALAPGALAEPDQAVRQAQRHRLLAQVYERTGAYDQAEASCRRGLALAAGPSAVRTETARLYAQLAEVLMRRGALAEAEAACQDGLAALPAAPAAAGERATLLYRLATVQGQGGAYAEAITALEESLGPARQAGDQLLIAAVLNNLGVYCSDVGDTRRALECYEESMRLKARFGDAVGQITTINNLGVIHMERGEREQALRHFEECRRLSEQYKLLDPLVFALANIGQLRYEQGDLAAARASLEEAQRVAARGGGDIMRQAHRSYLLGDITLAQGDVEMAHAYGQQALELARQAGRPDIESCALRVLAEALLAKGEAPAAAEALERAWALHDPGGDPYDRAWLLAARARLALARGDRGRALEDARASLDLAREQAIPAVEAAMAALVDEG